MSDHFSTVSLRQLTAQILNTEKRGTIFGIYKSRFFRPKPNLSMSIFGQTIDTPIGVAAGPHTQMAQNIITAWLCGARYIELKTVQTLDEIKVSKPCIDMQDEGYNCEWSQELKIEESFREYLKAWILIHLLHHKFGRKTPLNTIFNMSVGYDMAGILNDNVQWFFSKMAVCSAEKQAMIDEIRDLYPAVDDIEIPDRISDNITLSTMHGCPPDEIEKIGKYLLEKKQLHTFIKLNPTLLGKERIRNILKQLNFDTNVPDAAFEHDITYDAAQNVIRSLQQIARTNNLFFGVKLTNTLESLNHKQVFSDEAMYMSGNALHPISINVARMVRNDFPDLPISFCAGVNALNIADVLACGLRPVTVCSDILKPGGYARLLQYPEYIEANATLRKTDAAAYLNRYADSVTKNQLYQARWKNIKTDRILSEFDCIAAPCVTTCPSNQQVPDYMYWTAEGDLPQAFETILRTNPFPSVTGMVCDHLCQTKCTRINYDNALLIRDVKRYVAENVVYRELEAPEENGKHIAIIGAGPSGLSCAYFLRLAGFAVDVYETKAFPGGMLADAIPLFRLSEEALNRDIERIKTLGVKIHTNAKIDSIAFEKIRRESDYLYIAVGAQKSLGVSIPGDNVKTGLLDPLEFLSAVRRGQAIELGRNIVILGGGNTAMDAARTARRLSGKEGRVSIVYRRTRREMPADADEVEAALAEGIKLMELAAPAEILSENGKVTALRCFKMKLGQPDESGRARPEKIPGSEFTVTTDTIIPAFGQQRVVDFVDEKLLEISNQDTRETQIPNVYIGGDAFRGAATVIKAIADGRKTAEAIIEKAHLNNGFSPLKPIDKKLSHEELHLKRSRITPGIHPDNSTLRNLDYFSLSERTLTESEAVEESERCLYCDQLCDICVTVCPNRANVSYTVEPFEMRTQTAAFKKDEIQIFDDKIFKIEQSNQVLNIEDFCNECGNCTTFCPTSGAPYRDKPKVALTEKSFQAMEKGYFLNKGVLYYKENDVVSSLRESEKGFVFLSPDVDAELDSAFTIKTVEIKNRDIKWNTAIAIKMKIIGDAVRDLYER